ncbi:hypothetical protein BDZ97DRAFT_1911915 [Flammula alnicola]|nr:hypothetical protein BDZ97DRAFT_1911915 [Flammula alnicola]
MSTPAAFSRLQLAAALLEYDNDPDNPDAPYRSAQESAIFAHLRRNPAARPELAPRKSDYLGVSVPSETGSLGGRESALDTRRSRGSKGSIDALRNPFGADNTSESEAHDEGEAEGLEVDLASWGLDAFIPKDKKSAKARGKQPAPAVGSTRSRLPSTNHDSSLTSPRRGFITSKSVSLGGDIEANELLAMDERRRSFGSPLDLVGMEPSGVPFHHRRRTTSQASLTPSQPTLVPFPSASIRSPSPGIEQTYREPTARAHDRTYSTASMNSRFMLDEGRDGLEDRQRTFSNDTLGMPRPLEDNPFAIQNPSHISRFDPKAVSRARSYSNATMGSRLMPENDNSSVITGDPYARERRYSTTLDLLRPKVLVMPSPLQPVATQSAVEPIQNVRDGFELSADGPPLPPGARTSRRLSSSMSILEAGAAKGLIASNSFIPNPLMDLSSPRRHSVALYPFRVSLRTTKEETLQIPAAVDQNSKASRPAGKLYGKCLIDDLESRKAHMRSKQRVFTGDQRPSMMARASSHRVSTLIDPATLMTRPTNQRSSSYGSQNPQQTLARHPSVTIKPLITFDGEQDKPLQPAPTANRLPETRSVFGVDTIWQREMVKLKEIQAVEAKENEEKRKREEEAERKKQEKKSKRKKGKQKTEEESVHIDLPRVSAEPPMLPDIQRASRRVPPKPSDSDISSESGDEEAPFAANEQGSVVWQSSDEEDAGPRRTTGVGPRYPTQTRKFAPRTEDDDSEEDLPLAATINKARAKLSSSRTYPPDSEDEDEPLSRIILKAKSTKALSLKSRKDDEDDDQPLGLRASRIPLKPVAGDDEDDMPLAFHPEQQRRTQYQMLAQQQQQQQQMMMQAQLQSNMLMNSSMMGPSYYGPPMMNPMAMMQMQVPCPSLRLLQYMMKPSLVELIAGEGTSLSKARTSKIYFFFFSLFLFKDLGIGYPAPPTSYMDSNAK